MRRLERGFTLIGLMVMIAVINIGLGVAVTSWVTINKRAQEVELIWRGQQYVRALQCHRQQTGALPDELDELLESDCIRALYPDPVTRGGQWRLIREADLQDQFGRGGLTGDRTASRMLDSIDRELRGPEAFFGGEPQGGRGGQLSLGGPGGGARQGGGALQTDSLQGAYDRLRNLSERLRRNFASPSAIVGVVSTSTDEALRSYQGELTYDTWRFLVR